MTDERDQSGESAVTQQPALPDLLQAYFERLVAVTSLPRVLFVRRGRSQLSRHIWYPKLAFRGPLRFFLSQHIHRTLGALDRTYAAFCAIEPPAGTEASSITDEYENNRRRIEQFQSFLGKPPRYRSLTVLAVITSVVGGYVLLTLLPLPRTYEAFFPRAVDKVITATPKFGDLVQVLREANCIRGGAVPHPPGCGEFEYWKDLQVVLWSSAAVLGSLYAVLRFLPLGAFSLKRMIFNHKDGPHLRGRRVDFYESEEDRHSGYVYGLEADLFKKLGFPPPSETPFDVWRSVVMLTPALLATLAAASSLAWQIHRYAGEESSFLDYSSLAALQVVLSMLAALLGRLTWLHRILLARQHVNAGPAPILSTERWSERIEPFSVLAVFLGLLGFGVDIVDKVRAFAFAFTFAVDVNLDELHPRIRALVFTRPVVLGLLGILFAAWGARRVAGRRGAATGLLRLGRALGWVNLCAGAVLLAVMAPIICVAALVVGAVLQWSGRTSTVASAAFQASPAEPRGPATKHRDWLTSVAAGSLIVSAALVAPTIVSGPDNFSIVPQADNTVRVRVYPQFDYSERLEKALSKLGVRASVSTIPAHPRFLGTVEVIGEGEGQTSPGPLRSASEFFVSRSQSQEPVEILVYTAPKRGEEWQQSPSVFHPEEPLGGLTCAITSPLDSATVERFARKAGIRMIVWEILNRVDEDVYASKEQAVRPDGYVVSAQRRAPDKLSVLLLPITASGDDGFGPPGRPSMGINLHSARPEDEPECTPELAARWVND